MIKTAPLLFPFIKTKIFFDRQLIELYFPGQHKKVQASHFEKELCAAAGFHDHSILFMSYNKSESHDKRICTNGLKKKNRH